MEKREPLCTVGGNVDWCSHMENNMVVSHKLENVSALWPNNSTSGYISKGTWNMLKEYMHPYVHCIIYNSQDIEATELSINIQVGITQL